jgi:hypothetical protein
MRECLKRGFTVCSSIRIRPSFTPHNKTGKSYSLTFQRCSSCHTTSGHRFLVSHSCTNLIPNHCCATVFSNNTLRPFLLSIVILGPIVAQQWKSLDSISTQAGIVTLYTYFLSSSIPQAMLKNVSKTEAMHH